MSTITIPGPIARDVAEAAYHLLACACESMSELAERKDCELHPEWWEDAFDDFDALRGLIEILQPVEPTMSLPVQVGDECKETLMRAVNESIQVDSGILEKGVKDGMDEYWVRSRKAQLKNLKAFRHNPIVASGAVTA